MNSVYHRRWASAGANSNPRSVTASVEPHTCGTSWNSVRWNQPICDSRGGSKHLSRYKSIAESAANSHISAYSPSLHYDFLSSSKSNNDYKQSSWLLPPERSNNLSSNVNTFNDKLKNYRTSSLSAHKASSDYNHQRFNAPAVQCSSNNTNLSKTYETNSGLRISSASPSRSYPSRLRQTSATSNSYGDRLLAQPSNNMLTRAERPWRQRMADAARLRTAHGDEIGNAIHSSLVVSRARRNSVSSQHSGDELQHSLNSLKYYVDDKTSGSTHYQTGTNRLQIGHYDRLSISENSALLPHRYSTAPASEVRWKSTGLSTAISRSYSPIRPRSSLQPSSMSRFTSLSSEQLLPRSTNAPPAFTSANGLSKKSPKKRDIFTFNQNSILELPADSIGRRRFSSRERRQKYEQSSKNKSTESRNSDSDSSSSVEQHRSQSREKRMQKKLAKRLARKKDEVSIEVHKAIAKTESIANTSIVQQTKATANAKKILHENYSKTISKMKTPICKNEKDQSQQVLLNERSLVKKSANNLSNKKRTKTDQMGNIQSNSKQATTDVPEKTGKCRRLLSSIFSKISDDRKAETAATSDVSTAGQNQTAQQIPPMLVIEVVSYQEDGESSANTAVGGRKGGEEEEKYSSTNLSPISNSGATKHTTASASSIDDLSEASSKEQYGAVARFTPSKRSTTKSPAPVPGTWSDMECHQTNISVNKTLQRRQSLLEALTTIVIKNTKVHCNTAELCVCAPVQSLVEIGIEVFLKDKTMLLQESGNINKPIIHREIANMCAPTLTSINFSNALISRRQKCAKHLRRTIMAKSKLSSECNLHINEPSMKLIAVYKTFLKRTTESQKAQVYVLPTTINGVNHYRCGKNISSAPLKRPLPPKRNRCAVSGDREARVNSSTPQIQVNLSDPVELGQVIKLKRDILEQLRSESVASSVDDDQQPSVVSSRDDSPCLSTASELINACAVRVLEPARNFLYITTPSRSRLGSVESESTRFPRATTVTGSSQGYEMSAAAAATTTTTSSLSPFGKKSTLSSVGRKTSLPAVSSAQRSASLAKPTFDFDKPMTPFEQTLQNQAHRLRKSSLATSLEDESLCTPNQETPTVDAVMQLATREQLTSRRSSADRVPISSGFSAAAAVQPRHERYAAHIPVNRTTDSHTDHYSDSSNSGALETASRQLDQMIDQARYRHQQHRSKFKEAIDYLDQIFEDLKKEGGENVTSSANASQHSTRMDGNGGVNKTNVTSSPVSKNKKPAESLKTTATTTNIPVVKLRTHSQQQSKRSIGKSDILSGKRERWSDSTNLKNIEILPMHPQPAIADVDVVETIVLARSNKKLKGDRLDFTRKWLADDLKSWASIESKPDLLLGGFDEEWDADEHSLGSCSAEVAAINSLKRGSMRSSDVPDLIQTALPPTKSSHKQQQQQPRYRRNQPQQQSKQQPQQPQRQQQPQQQQQMGEGVTIRTFIRPEPVRPHPVYSYPGAGTDGFSALVPPPRDNRWVASGDKQQTSLQRVASHNSVNTDNKHSNDTPSWRGGSQEAYNTLNSLKSVRSSDMPLCNRKVGAFTPVQPPSIVAMSGSVNSLPESKFRSTVHPDSALTIDALVAELELNTDHVNVIDKRRSFPTGMEFVSCRSGDYEQPINTQHLDPSGQSNGVLTRARSDRAGRRGQNQSKKLEFDEMASMLQTAAGEMCSIEERGRKFEQEPIASKNSSTILSPFQTINQEKLNPSRVEALQSMFESKQHQATKRKQMPKAGSREDDNYYEINELTTTPKKEFSPHYAKPMMSKQSSSSAHRNGNQRLQSQQQQQHDYVPAFPVTQPPPHPPAGSTNSSQTGGYYSSGSSLGANSSSYVSQRQSSSLRRSPSYRNSLIGKQSASSRAASLADDEDDGFYDNLHVEERRFSRGSELDSVSIGSHRLPPPSKPNTGVHTADGSGNRLGQFLRKISTSKPPVNAASLVSLNMVTTEVAPTQPSPLMKSNSLSHDPWKKHVIGNSQSSQPRADKRASIGQRLKNSIFGSRKRLN